jgi:hypothetical protein
MQARRVSGACLPSTGSSTAEEILGFLQENVATDIGDGVGKR